MQDEDDDNGRVIPFPGSKHDPEPADAEEAADGHEYARAALNIKRSAWVRSVMLWLPSWITPNGVTIFRALLVAPIIWLLRSGRYGTALAVLALAMLLDFVDGALAKARGQKTRVGTFLDPLADKVLVCGTLLALLGRLGPAFSVLAWLICLVALALTMVRVIKLAQARRGPSITRMVAAKPSGKLKLIAETASLILIVLGLAVGWHPMTTAGCLFLAVALFYAVVSLRDQLFG